ncbi:MAG TPA: response regulator transcription factor [Schlesneria sp.]
MHGPHVCLFHRNRLLSECLAASLVETSDCDCSIVVMESFDADSPNPLGDRAIDLLLLDACLKDNLSSRVVKHMRLLHPQCKVLLLIAEQAVPRMLEWAQLSSYGCLSEDVGLADVRVAIQTVLAGQQYCSPHLANALLAQIGRNDQNSRLSVAWDETLITEREREILGLIACEQLGNKQIARQLGLSLYTVKNHVHNIIEKLGVQDRHEAVQFARRRGMVFGEQTALQGTSIRIAR